eukprot:1198143-Heterocapsa_arctica.AAC.1
MKVEVCSEVNFDPHRSVRTVFHPKLAKLKALAFRKPDKLPCVVPKGQGLEAQTGLGPMPRQTWLFRKPC